VQYPDNKIVTISGSKILERVDFGNTMKEGIKINLILKKASRIWLIWRP
jgi:hypothetical protein